MHCMGVFEMHNAGKCALLKWRHRRTDLCTKGASKSVFGYLAQVCVKCTMQENVRSWGGTLNVHTSAPNIPPLVILDAWYVYG